MKYLWIRRLWLFSWIVWREWEIPGGIPESYRIHYRLTIVDAWSIAKVIWR